MKIKTLAVFGLSGLLLLVVTIFAFVGMRFFYPPLLISHEFATAGHPFALIGAVYVSSSIVLIYFTDLLRRQHEHLRNSLLKVIKKRAWIFLVLIFSSISLGYITYFTMVRIQASLLHQYAVQENVEFQAIANSAWPAQRDIGRNCQHHLDFNTPRISPDAQFVCISWNQWLYFRDAEFPILVTLSGRKSYYGYELVYK